jgi:hypothetical protein
MQLAVQKQPYYGERQNYRGGRHKARQDPLKVLTKQRGVNVTGAVGWNYIAH